MLKPQTSPNFIFLHHRSLLRHPFPKSRILVFYCCITNDHKRSPLKQIHLLSHSSVGQKSRQCQLNSLLRVPQGRNQGAGQVELGKVSFHAYSHCCQNIAPCGCRTKVPISLLAVTGGCCSLKTLPGPCTWPPPSVKPAKVGGILLHALNLPDCPFCYWPEKAQLLKGSGD